MASYFLDPVNGSDTAAGTSYAAAWKTLGHALAAGVITPSGSGDTVYLAPGVYRGATTAGNTSFTSGSPLFVVGDYTGANTSGAAGTVRVTAYSTNDSTVPAGTSDTLALGAASHYRLSGLFVQPSKGNCLSCTAGGQDVQVTDCVLGPSGSSTSGGGITLVGSVGAALSWTIDRCTIWMAAGAPVTVTLPMNAGSDYDAQVTVRNCVLSGNQAGVQVSSSGAGAGVGGGVRVQNCTVMGGNLLKTTGTISTSIPCSAALCAGFCTGPGLSAAASGQVTDLGGNILVCSSNTNVTTSGNSTYNVISPVWAFGQAGIMGAPHRPTAQPDSTWPGLGLGAYGTVPSYDLFNRPRPPLPASGAMEHADGIGNVGGVATYTGPLGAHDVLVPVGPAATTISVQVNWDSNYGGGTLPTAYLVADAEIGVAAQSASATGPAGQWATVQLATFTPTKAGVARVRLSQAGAASTSVVQWRGLSAPARDTSNLNYFLRNRLVGFAEPQGSAGGIVGGGNMSGGMMT